MPEPGMGANNDHGSASASSNFGGGADHSTNNDNSSRNDNTTGDKLANSPTTGDSLAQSGTTEDGLKGATGASATGANATQANATQANATQANATQASATQASATPAESTGLLGQLGGVFSGIAEVGKETVSGLISLGTSAAKTGYDLALDPLADVVEFGAEQIVGRDLSRPDWAPEGQRGLDRVKTGADVVGTIVSNPGLVVDAVVDPIKDDWNNGRYGEAVGRGIAETLGVVLGAKGVDKLAKGTVVVDKATDIGRIADDLADVARTSDRAASGVSVVSRAQVDELARAGLQADRNGLTKAGRALQKHGDREGSVFPHSTGNPAARNQQGQNVLENILDSNNQSARPNRFGGQDIFDNDTGRGVRYDGDGNMKGFLEP